MWGRDVHGYYTDYWRSDMRPVELRHCPWPWVTFGAIFKSTHLHVTKSSSNRKQRMTKVTLSGDHRSSMALVHAVVYYLLTPCRCQWSINHRHSSPSSSVLCRRLHFPPAVMYLKSVVYISFPSSLLQVFFGRHLRQWPCGAFYNTCFAMLSSLFLRLCSLKPVTFST